MIDEHESIVPYASDWFPLTRAITLGFGTVTQLVGVNPERVGLFFWPVSGSNYLVGPGSQVTNNIGMQVSTTMASPVFTYEDWGSLISIAWFGASAAGVNSFVTEIIYRPGGIRSDVP